MNKVWQTSARGLALLALEDIFTSGAYSNLVLDKWLGKSQLSPSDKRLVTELVYGTVSRKLTLAWYLSHFIKDRDALDSWVYHLLMMSLYQLVYLDKLPAHAVVHEAVSLAKVESLSASKFVNAVLRSVLREGLPDISTIKRKSKRYATQYSMPVWLVNKLIDTYGEARAVAIFESLFVRSKASVRVVDMAHFDEIRQETKSELSLLSACGLTKSQGYFAGTDYFKTGALTIQDESSQLVAPTLRLSGEEEILDTCAAPGGKTTHIASYLTTGKVTALDLHAHKLKLIEDSAQRLGVRDRVITQQLDAREAHQHFAPDSFDKILVDAPCSGIGLIRRKPDIKYNKSSRDFAQLQAIQLEILASVCQTIKKGGIITYSTCTIVADENFDVLQRFLATHPNFEQVMLSHERENIVKEGCLLITPEQYGTDGFFIGQIRRKY